MAKVTTSFRFDDEDRAKLDDLRRAMVAEGGPGCRGFNLIDVVRVAIDNEHARRFPKSRKAKSPPKTA